MRVRYKKVGQEITAECDMTEKAARKLFEKLRTDGLCEWAELVGEDDIDYMEIIDDFDKTEVALIIASILGVKR